MLRATPAQSRSHNAPAIHCSRFPWETSLALRIARHASQSARRLHRHARAQAMHSTIHPRQHREYLKSDWRHTSPSRRRSLPDNAVASRRLRAARNRNPAPQNWYPRSSRKQHRRRGRYACPGRQSGSARCPAPMVSCAYAQQRYCRDHQQS